LESPDSLAINPVRAGLCFKLNERLHAWQGVGVTMAVAIAMADTTMGLPRVVVRPRALPPNAAGLGAVSLAL
jgi:hypothetical protein